MAGIVRGIVGHGADGEGVVVEILGIAEKSQDKIAAAEIGSEVAEEFAAVRVVAHVLNDGAAIGKAVGFAKIVGRSAGEASAEERFDVGLPGSVDDGFVGEDGVCAGWAGEYDADGDEAD